MGFQVHWNGKPAQLGIHRRHFWHPNYPTMWLRRRLTCVPVMWAADYGDVGQSRSKATLVFFYISYVAHMSQEKGE